MSQQHRQLRNSGSAFITARGWARLQTEYHELWKRRRPEVVTALAAAAAEGDRSENAEYSYRKKELRHIDRRIGYLQRRFRHLKVIDRPPVDQSRVYFTARVEVHDGERRHCYCLVGPDEVDLARGHISIDAPMARALLKRCVGDVVRICLPAGESELEILNISYDNELMKL